MKKITYMAIACLMALGLGRCSENETPVFDTDYAALNIWFGGTSTVIDSTTYNYSYKMGEGTLTFYARVSGVPVDYDRTFELEAFDGDLTLAEGSYRTDTYTIPAGEVMAECNIHFDTRALQSNDLFTEENGDGHLYFRVKPNDTFMTGTANRSVLKVVLKNYLSKPEEWDSAVWPYRPYYYYFGEYSDVKYQFMISVTGLVDFSISYTASVTYDEETNTISASYASYLTQVLQTALIEYNNDPNNPDAPLRDETGALITF